MRLSWWHLSAAFRDIWALLRLLLQCTPFLFLLAAIAPAFVFIVAIPEKGMQWASTFLLESIPQTIAMLTLAGAAECIVRRWFPRGPSYAGHPEPEPRAMPVGPSKMASVWPSLLSGIRNLPLPCAILIGAIIIGGSIAATPLVAPYRLIHGDPSWWRLNAVTGEAVMCSPTKGYQGYVLNCGTRQ
jgi:hypothetical protein